MKYKFYLPSCPSLLNFFHREMKFKWRNRQMKFLPSMLSLLCHLSILLLNFSNLSLKFKFIFLFFQCFSSPLLFLFYILISIKMIKYSFVLYSLLQSHAWFIKTRDWGRMLEYKWVYSRIWMMVYAMFINRNENTRQMYAKHNWEYSKNFKFHSPSVLSLSVSKHHSSSS